MRDDSVARGDREAETLDVDWSLDGLVGSRSRSCSDRHTSLRRFSSRASRFDGPGITRRRFLISSAALAGLLAVGCGSDDDSGDDETDSRVVQHKYGETQVPGSPERVVSVGWDEHDFILTFGYVPILQRDSWGEQPFGTWPWALPSIGEAEPDTFTDAEEIPFERIASLEPDLIMATWAGIDEETYNRLSEIAPTVAQHPDYEDWETPWDVRARKVGQVFGMEDEAERRIQAIADRITEIRESHPEWQGLEAVSVTVEEANFSVGLEGHSRGKLLLDFGFSLPQEIVESASDENTALFSQEQLQLIDCDLIVWVNGQDDPSPIVDLPLRSTLAAVEEGREVYCDKVLTAAFSIQSLMSYEYLLDALVPEIEAAIDGDPSTPVEAAVEYGLASSQ